MSWLSKLLTQVENISGRFETFRVESADDRNTCLRLLEQTRALARPDGGGTSTIESGALQGAELAYELYACRDDRSGAIAGCTRVAPAMAIAGVPDQRDEYHLDELTPELLSRTTIATRLALREEYVQSPASLTLLESLYGLMLDRGQLLCLLACDPGLYDGYVRLGFRPIGPARSTAAGVRIPMVLVVHDADHLALCRSPLTRTLKRRGGPHPAEGVEWFRALVARQGPIETGITPFSDRDGEVHRALSDGMSEAGRKALLESAVSVACEAGEILIREHQGDYTMGFVESGVAQVEVAGRPVALLGRGELFGEMALVLATTRTARVVAAAPGTRVLLLRPDALARVKDPGDREQLWRNVARVLAQRIARHNAGLVLESGEES